MKGKTSKTRKDQTSNTQNQGMVKAYLDAEGVVRIQGENTVGMSLDQAAALTCVDLGETLSVCEDPKSVLTQLKPYCQRTGAELNFSMPNAFYADRIADQLILDAIPNAQRAMTLPAIRQMLEDCHFQILQVRQEKGKKERMAVLADRIPAIAEQIDYYSDMTVDRNDVRAYQIRCGLQADEKKQTEHPFLSIVIRTTGDRLPELKEVMLGLSAQTCLDYEVLIMMHKVGEEQAQAVQELLEYVPQPLREKYRFIAVKGGSRARPLNRAIEEANGQYFAALDDDDLAMANWVEAFATGAKKAPGRVIHTYVVTQEWSRHGKDLRSESEKDGFYCQPFNWDVQYETNRSPFMTVAFPLALVRKLKYRFDETLETGEDWKFIMQVATVAGVYDVKECTAIYRKWVNAKNSTSLYSEKQWAKKGKQIQKEFGQLLKITKAYNYVPDGDAAEDEDTGEDQSEAGKYEEPKPEPEIRFGDQLQYADIFRYWGEDVHIRFKQPFVASKGGRVRIDPFAFGGFLMKSVSVYFYYADGKAEKFTGKQIKTNGLRRKDTIYFFFSDPQLYIDIREGKAPEAVELICTRSNELPMRKGLYLLPMAHMNLIRQTIGHFFRKIFRKG